MSGIVYYALAWVSFASAHTLFARVPIQKMLEHRMGGGYRLVYNGLSIFHILIVFAIGRANLSSEPIALLSTTPLVTALMLLKIIGLIIVLVSLTQYDLGRFSGITQLRTRENMSDGTHESFQSGGLNRWVRHPLYSGAFLLLWGGADSAFGFWTAVWGSVYLIVGTHFEERKLLRVYGDVYRQYQLDVPRYIPKVAQR